MISELLIQISFSTLILVLLLTTRHFSQTKRSFLSWFLLDLIILVIGYHSSIIFLTYGVSSLTLLIIWMLCGIGFATFIILGSKIRGSRSEKHHKQTPQDYTRRFKYLPLTLFAIAILSPIWGSGIYGRVCDLFDQRNAQPIVTAMKEYHSEMGSYPEPEIYIDISDYLEEAPTPICGGRYKMRLCNSDNLTIWIEDGYHNHYYYYRYHSEIDQWNYGEAACGSQTPWLRLLS